MKKVVIGASGYIGGALYEMARSSDDTLGTSTIGSNGLLRLRLDEHGDFDFGAIQDSDVVFLAAAISSPDVCSREHDRAWAVNVTGTSLFINKVISRGARVILLSSDTVYGEGTDKVDESAPSNPDGAYAAMKNEVETRFIGHPSFKTARLSYAFSREDRFTRYLLGCAERGEEAVVYHPFLRAVIHRDDAVRGVVALAQRWDEFPQPVFNFGGPEVISRVEFAQGLKDCVVPGLSFRQAEPKSDFFLNRPRFVYMESPLLPRLLGRPASSLQDAIRLEFGSEGGEKHS